jgi:hypothetical protein
MPFDNDIDDLTALAEDFVGLPILKPFPCRMPTVGYYCTPGRDAARVAYEEQGNTTKFFLSGNRPIIFSNSYTFINAAGVSFGPR